MFSYAHLAAAKVVGTKDPLSARRSAARVGSDRAGPSHDGIPVARTEGGTTLPEVAPLLRTEHLARSDDQQPKPHRTHDGLGAIADAELVEYPAQVIANRLCADPQQPADLLVGLAVCDMCQDAQLAL